MCAHIEGTNWDPHPAPTLRILCLGGLGFRTSLTTPMGAPTPTPLFLCLPQFTPPPGGSLPPPTCLCPAPLPPLPSTPHKHTPHITSVPLLRPPPPPTFTPPTHLYVAAVPRAK